MLPIIVFLTLYDDIFANHIGNQIRDNVFEREQCFQTDLKSILFNYNAVLI